MNNITLVNTKKCLQCKKLFNKPPNEGMPAWNKRIFCTRKCGNDSRKGKPFFDTTGLAAWNKGKTGWMSEEGRKRISKATSERLFNWTPKQRKERHEKTVKTRKERGSYTGRLGVIGILHESWKGDNASYSSKHKWIQKHWTKTGICEDCGSSPKPYGNRRWGTEWHNKDSQYNRNDRSSWLELCNTCHKKYG